MSKATLELDLLLDLNWNNIAASMIGIVSLENSKQTGVIQNKKMVPNRLLEPVVNNITKKIYIYIYITRIFGSRIWVVGLVCS